jgi:hypothetical protein
MSRAAKRRASKGRPQQPQANGPVSKPSRRPAPRPPTAPSARVKSPPVPDTGAGGGIIGASWIGTGLFTVTAVAAALAPNTLDIPAFVVSVGLFVVGLVVFIWAYVAAISRSRTDEIAVSSLYLLSTSAPRRVQVQLLGSLTTQVVVALFTAGARLHTTLAFGALVPLFGVALAGLWAARHGTFPPRVAERRRSRSD